MQGKLKSKIQLFAKITCLLQGKLQYKSQFCANITWVICKETTVKKSIWHKNTSFRRKTKAKRSIWPPNNMSVSRKTKVKKQEPITHYALMRNNQSTNQCAAQSCSFTFAYSETMDFRGKACSKNNSSLERVDSRVQHGWRLRVMGSWKKSIWRSNNISLLQGTL